MPNTCPIALIHVPSEPCSFTITALIRCVAALVAGVCAMIGLYPVVRRSRRKSNAEKAINPLFFHDIAFAYPTTQRATERFCTH